MRLLLPPASPATTPSPSAAAPTAARRRRAASVDPAQVYAEIEAEISRIRGLEATDPVDPIVLDDQGIRDLAEKIFREDNPTELVAANERLLKGLGLLDADASLEDLYIELLGSPSRRPLQPRRRRCTSSTQRRSRPDREVDVLHEFTHALQDQTFDITSLDINEVRGARPGDRPAVARRGRRDARDDALADREPVPDGAAQLIGESLNPQVSGSLDAMPAILRESLLFPYVQA